jgi:hypothetical protein
VVHVAGAREGEVNIISPTIAPLLLPLALIVITAVAVLMAVLWSISMLLRLAIGLIWLGWELAGMAWETITLPLVIARQQREAEQRDHDPMADSYGDVPRVVDRVWP